MKTPEQQVAEIVAKREGKPAFSPEAKPVRGKPFEPGNPGGGRPSFREEIAAMLLEMDDTRGKRKTRCLAEAWYAMAMGGSVQAMLGLWDRLEGAPKQTLDVTVHDGDRTEADIDAEFERVCAALEAAEARPATRKARAKAAPAK